MSEMISLLVVPMLSICCLEYSECYVSLVRSAAECRIYSVSPVLLLGGPGTIMMLGAHADEPSETSRSEVEPIRDLRVPIGAALPHIEGNGRPQSRVRCQHGQKTKSVSKEVVSTGLW